MGGRQRAWATDDGAVSVGIARALNNRWSMGLSRYRRAVQSGPSRHRLPRRVPHRPAPRRRWLACRPAGERGDCSSTGAWAVRRGLVRSRPCRRLRVAVPALVRQYVEFGRSKAPGTGGHRRPATAPPAPPARRAAGGGVGRGGDPRDGACAPACLRRRRRGRARRCCRGVGLRLAPRVGGRPRRRCGGDVLRRGRLAARRLGRDGDTYRAAGVGLREAASDVGGDATARVDHRVRIVTPAFGTTLGEHLQSEWMQALWSDRQGGPGTGWDRSNDGVGDVDVAGLRRRPERHQGGDPRRRSGDTPPEERTRPKPMIEIGGRPDPLAHHEVVCALRPARLRRSASVQGQLDQGVLPQLLRR